MDKQQLQKLLQKKYNRNEWNSILEEIFPSVNLLKEPEKIEVANKNVKSFHQTGLVRLNDGKNLAVFEVVLDEGINLLRNRVALRNLTTRYIDQANNHGVLVVYDQGKENYRFTFVSQESGFNEKGEWATFETASKRFTYVLGEGESCRTASERLAYLANKKNSAKIDDVIDAFSVERLSKEFFAKYKDHYQAFVDYLVASNFYKSAFDGEEKTIRDFVKKTLGRIVFLYFLQKKGWLGASDESYSDGDNSFMQTFWETSCKNETFYSLHLCRLFFNGLNATDRKNDTFEMPNGKLVKVPYLNGGLFDKDKSEPDLLTFPPKLFDGLFSFFSEYNFTIDENDPEEHEVGIDPEMLGHIFENLLEENKEKGAFYTPKEIVQFMTQESLIEYLKTGLEKKQILSDDEYNALKYFVRYKLKGDEIPKEDLKDDIVRFYQNQLRFIQTFGSQLNTLLDNVKICDPAIGSGAFPMGLLNEIYRSKVILNNTYSPTERADVKRHIIENSIYGVDIEKGAVDIARLRFWLSLIVDEEKPTPLPNLDYKIIVGDSIVNRFENEVIDIDWSLKNIAGGLFEQDLVNRKSELLVEISEKQNKYFEPTQTNKEKLKLEIRNLKLDLLINQLQLMIEQSGVKYHDTGKMKTTKQFEVELQVEGWKRTLSKLKVLKDKPEKPFNHFDWKLDFPELLNPLVKGDETGFDIVIGNPPYFQLREISDELQQNYKDSKYFKFAQGGRLNMYQFFVPLSIEISKNKSIICLITQNSILGEDTAINNRKLIFSKCKPIAFYSFPERDNTKTRVFETVKMSVAISLLKKTSTPLNDDFTVIIWKEKQMKNYSSLLINKGTIEVLFKEKYIIPLASNKTIGLLTSIKNIRNAFYLNAQAGEIDMSKFASKFNFLKQGNRVLTGAQILRYHITDNPSQGNVIYLDSKYIPSGKKASNLCDERICMQRITGVDSYRRLIMTIIPKNFLCSNSTNFISGYNKIELRYLLGILNSSLINFYYKLTSTNTNITTSELNSIPIPIYNNKYFVIAKVVNYILYIKSIPSQINNYVPNEHLVETFEEVIDAMVMELYFKEDFEREGIEFIKYAERDFKPIEGLEESVQIKIIHEAYQKLREKENEIRNNLKLMDTRLNDIVMPIKTV